MASTACFLHHHAGAALSTQNRSSSNRYLPSLKPTRLICRAQNQAALLQVEDGTDTMSRRLVLTVLIGQLPLDPRFHLLMLPVENLRTYWEAKDTDFLPCNGVGFKMSIPSKWNPSKEVEYPGQVLRYEDNFDSTSVVVLVTPTDKKSITDYGSLEDFFSNVDCLLGKQAYFGKTDSEGGFDSNAVATANILESSTPVIGGKPYYFISVLTRTADGDEGGKHQLITATVLGGKLYICKA